MNTSVYSVDPTNTTSLKYSHTSVPQFANIKQSANITITGQTSPGGSSEGLKKVTYDIPVGSGATDLTTDESITTTGPGGKWAPLNSVLINNKKTLRITLEPEGDNPIALPPGESVSITLNSVKINETLGDVDIVVTENGDPSKTSKVRIQKWPDGFRFEFFHPKVEYTSVRPGDPIELTWQADGIEKFDLFWDLGEIKDIPGSVRTQRIEKGIQKSTAFALRAHVITTKNEQDWPVLTTEVDVRGPNLEVGNLTVNGIADFKHVKQFNVETRAYALQVGLEDVGRMYDSGMIVTVSGEGLLGISIHSGLPSTAPLRFIAWSRVDNFNLRSNLSAGGNCWGQTISIPGTPENGIRICADPLSHDINDALEKNKVHGDSEFYFGVTWCGFGHGSKILSVEYPGFSTIQFFRADHVYSTQ
ncbi:hypothetical protein ACIQ9Q_41490 [Streptomyces sp. NPDC094438]|uniref:hypothetical protein n=1 Tax=Streptomyces sp. NPDC094438 TaxID=3366061 RepID=UPI00380233F4